MIVFTEHSVAQVALKWLLHQGGVDSVVIGAKRLSQLEDNMKAGDPNWTLSAEEVSSAGSPHVYIAIIITVLSARLVELLSSLQAQAPKFQLIWKKIHAKALK